MRRACRRHVERLQAPKTDGVIPSREPSVCRGGMDRSSPGRIDQTGRRLALSLGPALAEFHPRGREASHRRLHQGGRRRSVPVSSIRWICGPAGPSSNAAGAVRLEVTSPRLGDWSRSHCTPGQVTRVRGWDRWQHKRIGRNRVSVTDCAARQRRRSSLNMRLPREPWRLGPGFFLLNIGATGVRKDHQGGGRKRAGQRAELPSTTCTSAGKTPEILLPGLP